MTIRRFPTWYVGSLVFIAATGASGYGALERLHGHEGATQLATAAPLPDAKPQMPVAAQAAPEAPPSATPLPAMHQHVASASAQKLPTPPIPAEHHAIASVPPPAHAPAHEVAVVQRAPALPQVARYQAVAPTYVYYPYPSYYVYRSGYAYYTPYSRYPSYSAR